MQRKALCVGIDNYTMAPLHGCVSDAIKMADTLATNFDGSPNFDCKTLLAPIGNTTHRIDRPVLRKAVEQLFASKCDIAVLHFSGHGTVNNLDGFLVTQDACRYDEGISMGMVLQLANASRANEVVILLDCCYSGNLGSLPAIDNSKSMLREGISILTASRGDQVSIEEGGGGVFTSLVTDALRGGAADILGSVNAAGVYGFVEAALGAWDQRPLFKAHVCRLVPLRQCAPPIQRSVLRRLPALFPLPAEDFLLDPTFEASSGVADVAKVQVFAELQKLCRIHLVVPVGVDHMYDAAMKSRSCRLTPSGLYYWRLASDKRL